jgi:hypothetical protein
MEHDQALAEAARAERRAIARHERQIVEARAAMSLRGPDPAPAHVIARLVRDLFPTHARHGPAG